ncbi:MAG: radical SAM protein [Methanomassiliicoccales archaeon]|nr:MAG: radical SAM protein [Methanomassiliicoccales archaeon]
MPLTGVHLLLTYRCIEECDHCFVWSGPDSEGVMSLDQVKNILEQSKEVKTVNMIYVEGGEPFLYYPVMIETLRMAREMGFDIGLVTNTYWATDKKDSEMWLEPISKLGLKDFSISSDPLHYEDLDSERTKNAEGAADQLGIPTSILSIECGDEEKRDRIGKTEIGYGGLMYKGRAVEKLTKDAPKKPWKELIECPYENLEDPGRVHVDPYGYVHACQGLCIGNLFENSLHRIMEDYDYKSHPLIGPLAEGGPVALSEKYKLSPDEEYADACHFCYELRSRLREKFPEILCPKQMYGELD